MRISEHTSLLEPMLPPEGEQKLEDQAMDLAIKASGLANLWVSAPYTGLQIPFNGS